MARQIGIRVFRGDELVETEVFERDIIKIGRLASAHLRLEDPKVSRIHAVIDIAAGRDEVSIIDMGSAEGTQVNGEKVSRIQLKHGDEVCLGDSRLVVILDDSEVAALAAGGGVSAAGETVAGTELIPGRGELSFPEPSDNESGVFAGPGAGIDFSASDTEDPSVFDEPTVAAGGLMEPAPAPAPAPAAAEPAPAPAVAAVAAPAPAPAVAPPAAVAPPPAAVTPRAAAAPMPRPAGFAASPLPPIPEDPITPENRHVEVELRWGGTVVEVKRIRDVPKFVIGSHETDDLFMPVDEVVNDRSFDLIRQAAGSSEWVVRYTSKMGGTVTRRGQTVPLSQAGGTPDGDGYALAITDDMQVDLHFGYFSLKVKNVARSRAIAIPPLFDMLFINTALVTLFSFASLMSVLLLLPTGLDDDDGDLMSNIAQFQTVILKPPPKNNALLEKLKGGGKTGKAAKDTSGQAGKKTSKNKDGRMAAQAPKKTDEQIVASKLDALFGKNGNAGIAAIFGANMGGGELQAALGGITGSTVADAYGAGGLGLRGSGPGGGGTGVGTIGIGRVGTVGRGTGNAGYGSGAGGLGDRGDRDVKISQGSPIILGSLDKEIIRRIVREHMAQIRYCYEKELTRTPGIYGKIVMKWVINGDGNVNQAKVEQSEMKNANVESCMANKIKTWKFPKPKGGGIVIVNYPFVFKQGN